MFKKRLATLTTVLAVTSMLAVSVSAAEWNTDGGTQEVEGNNTVVEAAIEVELPGDLMFGINPLRLSTEDYEGNSVSAQIVTGQYTVINRSEVPVVVSASTAVTAATDVQLLATASPDGGTGELKTATGKRDIHLVQEYPKDITIDNEGNPSLSVNEVTIDNAVDGTGAALSATTPTVVNFSLDKFSGENLVPKNVGGFKFGGAVDPNGGYKEADITLKTTYTLKTVTETQASTEYTTRPNCFDTVVDPN